MAFATQALAAEDLLSEAGGALSKDVHRLPMEAAREIARLKLIGMGVEVDGLTEQQEHYLSSWDQGT